MNQQLLETLMFFDLVIVFRETNSWKTALTEEHAWTLLVVQQTGIHLPEGGAQAWPRAGKIPHAAEQLSPCSTAAEAHVPRAFAPQPEEPLQWEAREPQLESSPYLPLEEAHTQKWRPNAGKKKNWWKNINKLAT